MKTWKTALRHLTALMLCLVLCISLSGCAGNGALSKSAVSAQSVSMLMGLDLSGANRYGGIAEAKSVEKVAKDDNKDVAEVKVKVGQQVKQGDVLFEYDLESVRLSVEAAELEVEQLANSITSFDDQIQELERDKRSAGSGEKLSYSLQIQETKLDKAEAEYNLKKKEKELDKLKKSAEKTTVKANVAGVVQSINQSLLQNGDSDSGMSGDDSDALIVIMETGTYRVKGSANETNIAALSEGMAVTVYSRTDYSQQWTGVISEIDTGSTEKEDSDSNGSDDGSESSSRYSFYVQLDNSDGMMMGQHLYILPGTFPQSNGILISSSFVVKEGDNSFVWAANSKDTLEKRSVTLGEYDEANDSYLITDGLSMEDYIVSPSNGLVEGLPVVKYDAQSYDFGDGDSSMDGVSSAWGSAPAMEEDASSFQIEDFMEEALEEEEVG